MATNKQRREASRRQLQRQLERRQVQDERRKKFTLVASIAGTIILVAVIVVAVVLLGSGSNKKKPTAAGSNSASGTPTPSATKIPGICDYLAAGTAAKKNNPPSSGAAIKGTVTVTAKTNLGDIVMKLNRAEAPCTVSSFVSLVQQKFFDNTSCHRLVTSGIYVLQCGDPTGQGSGGPGYSIPDEATGKETYPAGTLAMARTQQAHSGGSQIFIVDKDSPSLQQNLGEQQYTVFGTITKGLDIVTKVAAKGTDNSNGTDDGHPKQPVKFLSMTVTSSTKS